MGLLLDITPASNGTDRILSVRGEVDIATVGELEEKISEIGDSGLILDLTATDFMDSSGLRLLVSTHERFAAEGGRFRLAVRPGPLSRRGDSGLRLDLPAPDCRAWCGLRLRVPAHERCAAEGGRVRLAVRPGAISRLLEVTGLMGHRAVHETVEEAASA